MSAQEWVARARERQGLTETITDAATLAKLAVLLNKKGG